MPHQVRLDAIKEAETLLRKQNLNVDLRPLTETDEQDTVPLWQVVLKAALHCEKTAAWLFSQPDFLISLLPPELRSDALMAYNCLEGRQQWVWSPCPYPLSAVRWAWRQCRAVITEQIWRTIKARLGGD